MRLTLPLIPFALLIAGQLAAQNRPVPIENEYVRVVSVTDAPVAQPGTVHEHKDNRVMIYLDSGDIEIRYTNGKLENQHWKPGDVAWSPASGMHTSQNVSQRPIRIVEIELRKQPGAGETAPPDRTRAVIDNSQVRVYQALKPPASGNYVAVDIRSGTATWDKLPEGSGPFVITQLK
jgi:hypothetical protein